jgi:hypothetical protein
VCGLPAVPLLWLLGTGCAGNASETGPPLLLRPRRVREGWE